MRKYILTALLTGFFLFGVSGVYAKVISSPNGTVNVAKDEVIDDDLFIGAQNATIDGTVNGDVFVGAQTVKISGTINGNLHVGAQYANLDGTVKNNVYVGAQDITILGGAIDGSLIAGGQNISINNGTKIGGSVMAGGANVTINAPVGRSVYAGAGYLSLGASTVIDKDLYYSVGKNQIAVDKNAKVVGAIHKSEYEAPKKEVPTVKKEVAAAALTAFGFFGWIVSLIGALVVGFIYLKLFAQDLGRKSKIVTASLWKSLGIGFLVTMAFLPGIIVLLMTVIGIPVAGLAVLFFLLYWYLAKIVVGTALGTWISGRFNWKLSPFWTLALGLFAIAVLHLVPFIGFLTGLAVFWLGLGAQTLAFFSKEQSA